MTARGVVRRVQAGPRGIVSKRKDSDWLKMKNPACEAVIAMRRFWRGR
jgi:hypothetical protein